MKSSANKIIKEITSVVTGSMEKRLIGVKEKGISDKD